MSFFPRNPRVLADDRSTDMSVNPFISNGTCYYGRNLEAAPAFLACGNDEIDRKSCCQAGDMCLSSRACYNGRYGVTYLAGCTDPEYNHSSCPDKGIYTDSPWTGLSRCDASLPVLWVQCAQKDVVPTLTTPAPCYCTEGMGRSAFTDKSVLDNIASLPATSGGSIGFQAGFAPPPWTSVVTVVASASPTSSPSTSTNLSTTSTATSMPSESVSPDMSTSMSPAALAGIGAGAAIAGLLLIGTLIFIFLMAKHKKKIVGPSPEAGEIDPNLLDPKEAPNSPAHHSPDTNGRAELELNVAHPWTLRSELDGGTRSEVDGESKRLSELPG